MSAGFANRTIALTIALLLAIQGTSWAQRGGLGSPRGAPPNWNRPNSNYYRQFIAPSHRPRAGDRGLNGGSVYRDLRSDWESGYASRPYAGGGLAGRSGYGVRILGWYGGTGYLPYTPDLIPGGKPSDYWNEQFGYPPDRADR